jgi:hypothetical protein
MASWLFLSDFPREKYREVIAASRICLGFGCLEGLAREVDNGLRERVIAIGLSQPGELNRFDDVDELPMAPDARMGLAGASGAGVVVVHVNVVLAYLVGGIIAGLGIVLLVEDLNRQVAEEAFGF